MVVNRLFAFICIIVVVIFTNTISAMSLKNIWRNEQISDQYSESLFNIYSSEDGYEEWKKDAEYLMSSEFTTQYLEEITNIYSMTRMLQYSFYSKTSYTVGFEVFWCQTTYNRPGWKEEDRDKAFYFMDNLINFYISLLKKATDTHVKDELIGAVIDWRHLKRTFSRNTNQEDVTKYIKKSYLFPPK